MADARELDAFNQSLRANSGYTDFLRSLGADPSGALKLSDQQRKQAESWVRSNVSDIGKLEIDPAGNANQREGFTKQLGKWGPIVGGAALTAFGIPGVMPGLFGGGAAAGAGASAASAGTQAATGLLPQLAPGAVSSALTGVVPGAASAGASGMSLLGSLGKIGGWLGKNASSLTDLGGVVSGAAKGSAGQRMAENNQALDLAQLAQQGNQNKFAADLASSNAQFGAGMQGAQFNREGQDREQKAGMLKALLSNLQDVQISGMNPNIASRMPTISGGLRPSALTGGGGREALLALLSRPQVQAPGYTAPTPYVHNATPELEDAGLTENILGGVGLGAGILGALGTPRVKR